MSVMTDGIDPATRFVKTDFVIRKELFQAVSKTLFRIMVVIMIIPLLSIIAYLVYNALPSLNWEFLIEAPKKGMSEGGIWPAFVGTLYLVVISLAIAAPIGVFAAIYLNEYAKENWFNRIIHLAVINLAGVPGIAFPVGFDESNLPIGIQLIGGHFREEQLFQIAHAYQLTTDWHKKTPVF